MTFLSLNSALLVAISSLLPMAYAYTVLNSQCWHETTLQTITFLSHPASTPNNTRELVVPCTNSFNPPVSFHLPWPWTNPPVCTHPLASLDTCLCIYTSSAFARGRGISIVTTPSLAAHVASLPAFTTPSLLDTNRTNEFSGSWFTSNIPYKGIGTLALHNIEPGTKILQYTPALLAYLESELSTLDREALWRVAINQLPEKTKSAFLELTYIYGDERVRVQDITKANTFQLSVRGHNHLAIFPESSRLNHDCAPNAQYVVDPELLTHTIRVTRAVDKGEELTVAYTSPLDMVAARQERLASGFHFACRCARCTEGERSDAVLARINALQAQLNDWSSASQASPKMAEALLKLYVEEGLEGFLDIPYGFAALAYNAVGKAEDAKTWAAKAKGAVLIKDGTAAEALKTWDDLMRDAEAHWSYNRRI